MDTEPSLQFIEQFCNQVIEDLDKGRHLYFNYINLTRMIELLKTIEQSSGGQSELKAAFKDLRCCLMTVREQITLITDN